MESLQWVDIQWYVYIIGAVIIIYFLPLLRKPKKKSQDLVVSEKKIAEMALGANNEKFSTLEEARALANADLPRELRREELYSVLSRVYSELNRDSNYRGTGLKIISNLLSEVRKENSPIINLKEPEKEGFKNAEFYLKNNHIDKGIETLMVLAGYALKSQQEIESLKLTSKSYKKQSRLSMFITVLLGLTGIFVSLIFGK